GVWRHVAQHPGGFEPHKTGAIVEPSRGGVAGDRALPGSFEPLETLRHQESPSDCTPDLIAYIHALYAKIPQVIILSTVRPFMYLAGVKVGFYHGHFSSAYPGGERSARHGIGGYKPRSLRCYRCSEPISALAPVPRLTDVILGLCPASECSGRGHSGRITLGDDIQRGWPSMVGAVSSHSRSAAHPCLANPG